MRSRNLTFVELLAWTDVDGEGLVWKIHSIMAKLLYLLCLVVGASAVDYDGKVRAVGDGRYEAYMIPPYQSNHASFLELLPSGDQVMAWFSGTAEGANNCSIVVARLPSGSDQWSKAQLVSRREGYSNQNPVLWYDNPGKRLYLFHTQQPADSHGVGGAEAKAQIWELLSGEGYNWTKPILLFSKDGSFDRNRIVLSLQGAWIFPIYYAVEGDENEVSGMQISKDHSRWSYHEVHGSNYLVQPSVIRPTPGKSYLLAFFRDRRAEHIYSANSTDEGESWTNPEATQFPNNNAAIQATVLANGHIALVYNPMTSHRNTIRIVISEDGGKTWPYYKDLENTSHSSDEFSYPSILQSPDGYIHVTYTYLRETIKYVKFMESWVH